MDGVYHADDTHHAFTGSTEPTDKASVHIEEAGHYCLSFIENADEQAELLPVVFDTSKVFEWTLRWPAPTDWRDRVSKRLSTTPVRIRQDILGLSCRGGNHPAG
jgi:hypothetical protein